MFHHAALWSKIALEDGDRAVFADRLVKISDNVGTLQTCLLQVLVAAVIVAVFLQVFQVFSQGFTGDCHHIQMKH